MRDRHQRLKSSTENVVSLSKKCNLLEERKRKCDDDICACVEQLKRVFASGSQKERSSILSKNILCKMEALFHKRGEIDYELRKYCYHRKRGQGSLFALQDEIRNSSS